MADRTAARRLASVHRQLLGGGAVRAPSASSVELPSDDVQQGSVVASATKGLLSDERLQEFIRNGVVELDVMEHLPASYHAAIAERAQEHHNSGRWPGSSNNIYSAMPELRELFTGPTCAGALESVLGPGYVMHAHRHMHVTGLGGFQQFHKDGQSGHGPVRHHRVRWAMIMYYPGGASLEMGPTAVIPSSHLLSIDHENWKPIVDPKGDPDAPVPTALSPGLTEYKVISPPNRPRAIMIHYDMLHRGTGRLVEESPNAPWRAMFKFQFMRTQEPSAPSHNSSGDAVPTWPDSPLAPAWQSQWEWLHGAAPGSMPCSSALLVPSPADAILDTTVMAETKRIGAAYSMAREGDVQSLHAALLAGQEAPRRAAMYGLSAAGDAAVPTLLKQLSSIGDQVDPDVRSAAVFALGECASPTLDVIRALHDSLARAKGQLRGEEEQSADLFSSAGETTGPGSQPGDAWKELQVVGQAVVCFANKLAAAEHEQQREPGVEQELLSMASELLQARNVDLLPPDASADDSGVESESDGAVSNRAPGLRRHGVHSVLSLATCHGITGEWKRQLTETAMAATRDKDRYVQQPAWQALQRLSFASQNADPDELIETEGGAATVEMRAVDRLIDRLVDLRMCPVTATGSGF